MSSQNQEQMEELASLRKFVGMIARLTMDGEIVDGEEFVLENDDAVDTLHGLIEKARTLTGSNI